MNVQIVGQALLGGLLVVALLLNVQLGRLGRRHRRPIETLASPLRALLLWLPWGVLLLVAGGMILAEISLLRYHDAQNLDGLSWFVVGACLMILADLFVALVYLPLREAFKVADMTGRLTLEEKETGNKENQN